MRNTVGQGARSCCSLGGEKQQKGVLRRCAQMKLVRVPSLLLTLGLKLSAVSPCTYTLAWHKLTKAEKPFPALFAQQSAGTSDGRAD